MITGGSLLSTSRKLKKGFGSRERRTVTDLLEEAGRMIMIRLGGLEWGKKNSLGR